MRYPQHGTLEVIVDRERLEDPDAALVTLEDAAGKPLNAWTTGAAELASRWRLPEEGSLRLTGVVAGTVRVTVSSGANDAATREALVEGGEETAVRIP